MQSLDMNLLKVKPTFSLNSRTNTNAYMMTPSPPSFCDLVLKPSRKHWNKNLHRSSLQVIRAQSSFKDEGRSSNMVDANLRILRERIEEVRNKERLERCCNRSEEGWNYAPVYNSDYKRETILSQCFHLVGLMAGTVGLTILSATFFLCFVSLLLQALCLK